MGILECFWAFLVELLDALFMGKWKSLDCLCLTQVLSGKLRKEYLFIHQILILSVKPLVTMNCRYPSMQIQRLHDFKQCINNLLKSLIIIALLCQPYYLGPPAPSIYLLFK